MMRKSGSAFWIAPAQPLCYVRARMAGMAEKDDADPCARCGHYRGVHGDDGKCYPSRGGRVTPESLRGCDCKGFVEKAESQRAD